MTTKLIPNNYRLRLANQLLESVNEKANTAYYVFVGNHVDNPNSEIQPIADNDRDVVIDVYNNMIFGKRVTPSDVKLMIRNIPYTVNTTFAIYDDSDKNLNKKDFYCIVNASSWYHVYKCLDNNNGSKSTIQPNFADIVGSNTAVYQTSDGYRWKYMYSVSSSINRKFSTSDYFPYVPNTVVQQNAVSGSIDIIKVEDGGEGYDNYTNGTFSTTDLRIGGDANLYKLSNPLAEQSNGFYTDCLIYIYEGIGVGQYSKITNHFSNSEGNYIFIDNPFPTKLTNGSKYQIYPSVNIKSYGTQTINAVARALINATSSNSVYRIEILNRGLNYNASTATVLANSVVGVTEEAILRPIFSPSGGHGSDPAAELGATNLGVSVTFEGSEGNTIPYVNEYKQIGIITDPKFIDVTISTSNQSGSFITGETFYKINPVRVQENVTVNSASSVLTYSNGDFLNQFSSNVCVYITSANGGLNQLAFVNSVTNSSQLILSANALFTDNAAVLYFANATSTGIVNDIQDGNTFIANSVVGEITNNDKIIGQQSGAFGYVSEISRSGKVKSFDTFTQLYKYTGTSLFGTFQENEVAYQANANAYVHSAIYNGSNVDLYLSNLNDNIIVGSGNTISGYTSLATMQPIVSYKPEIAYGSGKVIYVENIAPITRQSLQKETLKIIFKF